MNPLTNLLLPTSLSTSGNSRIFPVQAGQAIEYGYGWDFLENQTRNCAIDFDPPSPTADPGPVESSGTIFTVEQSLIEVTRRLEANLSARFSSGAVSVSGAASMFSESFASSYCTHLVCEQFVRFEARPIQRFRGLTKDARDLLKRDRTRKTFRQIYGTGYVNSITRGASQYTVFTHESDSNVERNAASVSFTAAHTLGNINGEVKNSFQRMSQTGKLDYRNYSKGILSKLAGGLEAVLKSIADFGTEAVKKPGKVLFEVFDYPLSDMGLPDIDWATLRVLENNYADLRSAVANWQYVIRKPHLFVNPNLEAAGKHVEELSAALSKVDQLVSQCFAGAQVKVPSVGRFQYEPPRWDEVAINPQSITAVKMRIFEILAEDTPMSIQSLGSFSLTGPAGPWLDYSDARFKLFNVDPKIGLPGASIRKALEIPARKACDIYAYLDDDPRYDDNRAKPDDPLRVRFGRHISYAGQNARASTRSGRTRDQ